MLVLEEVFLGGPDPDPPELALLTRYEVPSTFRYCVPTVLVILLLPLLLFLMAAELAVEFRW